MENSNIIIICAHRINKIEDLKQLSTNYGVEIDVRAYGKRLILNHEPYDDGDDLEEYLKEYNHKFIIFNIKEAGIENEVKELAKKYNVEDYFLLDVEYPFIYRSTRKDGFKKIAIRYSEAENINFTLDHENMVEWVWIDTNSKLPMSKEIAEKLKNFKLALVAPDRWGRPENNKEYFNWFKDNGVKLDLVMTEKSLISDWE